MVEVLRFTINVGWGNIGNYSVLRREMMLTLSQLYSTSIFRLTHRLQDFFFYNLGLWSQSKTECFTHFLISGHFHSSDAKDVCMFHCKILSFHSFKFSFKLTVHFITAHHYVKLIFQTKFFPSSQKNFNVVCSSLSTPVLCWFT